MNTIQAEYQQRKNTQLDGHPVWLTRYRLGRGFVTEIGCKDSGEIVARGTGTSADESFLLAIEVAIRRLRRRETFALTVGG